jgi:predicted dehydrogenase
MAAAAHVSDPRYVEAVRASGFTGRSADIGVVHDLMIHDIDLVLSLVDAPLVSVAALGLAILGRPEDVAQARLEFANGCVANLSASRVSFQPTPRRQMQIWGAESFAAVDFGVRSATVVHPCRAVLDRQFDFESLTVDEKSGFKDRVFQDILPVETLAVESRNALADEQRDFAESIRAGRAPRVTGQHGRNAVAVAEQILQAIAAHASPAPRTRPAPPILRGPHWTEPRPIRREAG